MASDIRFIEYPRTAPPSAFTRDIVESFRAVETRISTRRLKEEGLGSDDVLEEVRPELENIGFRIEGGDHESNPLERPLLFGENGEPGATYRVDGYHERQECILEVEAGRGAKSNAVHRDLIRAMTISGVEFLILAVPNLYERKSMRMEAYNNVKPVIERLYRSNRVDLPFGVVLLGY